jgi:hypothetical protein
MYQKGFSIIILLAGFALLAMVAVLLLKTNISSESASHSSSSHNNRDYVDEFFSQTNSDNKVIDTETHTYREFISFEYPSNYKVGNDARFEDLLSFQSPNYRVGTVADGDHLFQDMVEGNEVVFNEVRRSLPAEQVIEDYWNRKNMSPYYKEITMGGLKGFLNVNVRDGEPVQYQASAIDDQGVVYVFTANWIENDEEERLQAMNTLNVIMSSFRFIDN